MIFFSDVVKEIKQQYRHYNLPFAAKHYIRHQSGIYKYAKNKDEIDQKLILAFILINYFNTIKTRLN